MEKKRKKQPCSTTMVRHTASPAAKPMKFQPGLQRPALSTATIPLLSFKCSDLLHSPAFKLKSALVPQIMARQQFSGL
jgi:hypothetical protein